MSKSFKYVEDFEFPSEFGFSGSAGKQQVKGYARGGKRHSDAMQDKKMVRAAVHKHEKAQHPGEPLTKMRGGGGVGQGRMKKQGPQDGSGPRRGKGSFNSEPMLKCGKEVKR